MWTEQRLNSVLEPIRHGGGYRFAQLRHTPWDVTTVRDGDIDLLGDESSVAGLLKHLYQLAVAGVCHYRVRRTNPDKTRVTLYSPDMIDRVELDLWVNLYQFQGGERGLRFEDVAKALTGHGAIQTFPLELEAAIYLQHLIAKRKDLASPSVQKRLSHYASACRGMDMAGHVYSVLNTRKIAPAVESASLKTVEARAGRPLRRKSLATRIRAKRFPKLMDARVIAFIGCDGVGKSSVIDTLAEHTPGIEKMLGKQLYRQSLTFRGAYKINKATIRKPSEWVDETLAPFAFSCARRALTFKLRYHRDERLNVLLLDRYLGDYLYVGRKRGEGKFVSTSWLCSGKKWQCPLVHFVVPYSVLAGRKQEISEAGQRAYDHTMIDHYTNANCATDYLVYCNSGTVEQAAVALGAHLTELFEVGREIEEPRERPDRPATPVKELVSH